METTHKVHIGSVSTGTLRTEDLLEAFAWELGHLATTPSTSSASHIQLAWLANEMLEADGMGDEREEEAAELVSELIDALQEYAPILCYFGAHPGDGADFGFWPDWDALEEEMRYAEDTDEADTKYLPDANVLVQVSDHGNILVMDVDRKELWSVA